MPILELNADRSVLRRILRAISGALFRHVRVHGNSLSIEKERPSGTAKAPVEVCRAGGIRRRLAEGVAALERLNADRARSGDLRLGKAAEDRIVWDELIELELQEIDEQVSRICGAAGRDVRPSGKSDLP